LFLPDIGFFVVPLCLLIVGAYVVEGRWVLSRRASNALGYVIAVGAMGWLIYPLLHLSTNLLSVAPWPAAFLPYLAPVLMVLVPHTLLRPNPPGVFCHLLFIVLRKWPLAGFLPAEPLFALFLFAYLVCGLWSLMLFCAHEWAHESVTPAARQPSLAPA